MRSLSPRILAPLALLVSVFVVGVLVLREMSRSDEARAAVLATRDGLDALDDVRGQLLDVETGQRGYLLTGDARYLEPYRRARGSIDSSIDRAKSALSVVGIQGGSARVDSIERLAAAKLEELTETIRAREQGGLGSALRIVARDSGRRLMDEARRQIAALERDMRVDLGDRMEAVAASNLRARKVILLGLLASALLAILLNLRLERALATEQRVTADLTELNRQLDSMRVILEARTVELDRARHEALSASSAKSVFLATMSHELRTPLTAIMGYGELLQDGVSGPVTDLQKQQLQRIRVSSQHLLELIEEVLTMSRLEARRETASIAPIRVADAVHEAAEMIAPIATDRRLGIVVDPIDASLVIAADATKLRQVLVNLMSNGLKFTDQGGVHVRARAEKTRVAIEIQDSGIGIAPSDLDRIFEPFWQVEQSPTRRVGGSGLGLTVTRGLVEIMGGDISVSSREGEGSTFTVRFPTAPTPTR